MDVVPFSEFFPFVHPQDADALARTSKFYQHRVETEYHRIGRTAVLPGGCWHHHLCKRARESVAHVFPNPRPRALASLVDNRCVRCKRRLLARVCVWGFTAHAVCVRDLLLNTFYIPEKLGLNPKDLAHLPHETRQGFNMLYHETYDYQVVFRRPYRRLVPVEWTLQHAATVVHAAKVASHRRQKQQVVEMLQMKAQQKVQRASDLTEKRRNALAARRAKLEAHPLFPQIDQIRRLVGAPRLLGDYLEPLIANKTSLARIVARTQNVPRLRQVLQINEMTDLDADPNVAVRAHVKRCLDFMVTTLDKWGRRKRRRC